MRHQRGERRLVDPACGGERAARVMGGTGMAAQPVVDQRIARAGIEGAQVVVARADIGDIADAAEDDLRSEEHTSELQSLMRISYAVFCLKKINNEHSQLITYSIHHIH